MIARTTIVAAWCVCTVAAAADAQSARQLVIPFENATRDPQAYWLSEGSAVMLTDDLRALGAPVIAREDRLRAFQRLRVPPATTLSHATVIRLGQIVGATDVVVGAYELDDDEIVVRARPIRLDTGRMAAEIVERGPLAEIFDVYARIARRLVPDSRVTPEELEQGRPPIAALEQYVKGLLAQTPDTKTMFLTQALRLYPTLHRAHIELWHIYTQDGEHQQALAAVREVDPDHRLHRQARFLSGVSLMHFGQYPQAFTTFSELQAAMSDPALLNNLGVVQLRRPAGSPGGSAVSYFSQATQVDDADADLFFNLGYAHWLAGDVPSAVHWLREAVRRNAADDGAHYVLGAALEAAGSPAEAAREKELARRLSSEYAVWEAQRPGVTTVPRGLERIKTDVDVPASLRVERAIDAAEQRDQQATAAFYLETGKRAYEEQRDLDAIASLRRAVFLSPYEAEAHLYLGRAYLRSGRIDEAIDALKISIWSEDAIDAHLVLAEAYFTRDEEAARSELEWILKADPNNGEARRLLERLQ